MRDAMAESQDQQKQQADTKNRSCIERYQVGDQVLLNAKPTYKCSVRCLQDKVASTLH